MTRKSAVVSVAIGLLLAGCSGGAGLPDSVPFVDTESANVKSVKNGSLQGCPLSTLGDMADAFFGNPQWSDFTATDGGEVVVLSGDMSLSGAPATALMQFTMDGFGGFEVAYLELNGEAQNKLVLGVLVEKMCAAV